MVHHGAGKKKELITPPPNSLLHMHGLTQGPTVHIDSPRGARGAWAGHDTPCNASGGVPEPGVTPVSGKLLEGLRQR